MKEYNTFESGTNGHAPLHVHPQYNRKFTNLYVWMAKVYSHY